MNEGRQKPFSADELAVIEFFDLIWGLVRQARSPERWEDPSWDPTNAYLAKAVSVSPSTIGHWEKKKRLPRAEQVRTLCKKAGRSQDECDELVARRARIEPLWLKAQREGVALSSPQSLPDARPEAETGAESAGTAEALDSKPNDTDVEAHVGEEDTTADMGDTVQIFSFGSMRERNPDVKFPATLESKDPPPPPRYQDVGAHRTGHRPPDPLERASQVLFSKVYEQWEQEAARRELSIPPPIPPRWVRTERPLSGAFDSSVDSRAHRTHGVLPGADPVTGDMADRGGLDELFSLYAGLGPGRILLMGGPGSGKSATAIMLLLNELDRRGSLDPDQAARTPIPVLLQARNWDPRQDLLEWFAGQLETVYDILPSREYGPDPADALVREGRVALFLDEFDEMDKELRAMALAKLNPRPLPFRLIMLTRIDDFASVVEDTHRPWYHAITLELAPVAHEDAIVYLRGHQRTNGRAGSPPSGDELQQLIDLIKRDPDHPVSQAMDTPLNLSLIHDDRKAIPALLQNAELKTRGQVEDALVRWIIPRNYRPDTPGPSAHEAEKWLGFLAAQMGNDSGLDWRTMHRWAPAWERCLFNTLAGLLIMSGIGMLVFGPVGQYTVTGHTGILFGLWYGATMGTVFGLMASLISEARAPHRNKRRLRWLNGRLGFNPAIGLFLFLVVTMAVGNQSGNYWLGALAGATAACLSGSTATVPRVSASRRWWTNWSPNGWDLLAALSVGAPIGWAYGITKSVSFGVSAGLITAFTFGLMASVVRPPSDGDTPPSPDALWAHDRQQTLALGLMTGIPVGLALGFQNGRTHGLLAGIVATLGLGTIIALGAMAGSSDIWRVTLLFGQLRLRKRFPLRGMRFLTKARDRQVLRTAGPEFEFRHSRLRTTLSDDHQRQENE